MNYKMAGDPPFDDYSMTFLNDSGFYLRKRFEQWLSNIADPIDNVRGNHDAYKTTISLAHLDVNNNAVANYHLHGCYPKNIGAIELGVESTDTLEEFTVDFSVDYWTNNLKADADSSSAMATGDTFGGFGG